MSEGERAEQKGARRIARRPPTSVDVARLAGVSQKTVSRVLNSEPYVSADVQERVLAAVRELGYRRNQAAATLIRGRSKRIGMVSLGSSLWGVSTLLLAIEAAVRRAGYSFTLVNTLEGDEGGIATAMRELLEQGVDGIVLLEPIDGENDLGFVDAPVLSFGQTSAIIGPHVVVAGPDNIAGGSAATEHLLALGHRTVWHVAGPQRWFSAQDRLAGWRQSLEAAGAVVPPVIEGDWSAASGYAAGLRLADQDNVTAVFAANDEMAIGAISALRDRGLAVPAQVSIVGYDDSPIASYIDPPLTTVRQDFVAAAKAGFSQLLEEIEGKSIQDRPRVRPLPVQLTVRQSTLPPRAATLSANIARTRPTNRPRRP